MRLALIEGARAKERMAEGGRGGKSATPSTTGKTRDKVAEHLGTSATQLRQDQFIADNADLLDPADFADWDELNIEISENDVRKGFTKSERVDYIRRLLRIEQAKAKERQASGTSVENSTEVGRSDEITAAAFGMKKDTMRRELFIADNADMLDPADFADWDELNIEISENECRKEFTKTERLEYARRLALIESARAKERMLAGKADPVENSPQGKTREIVARQLGTSSNTIARDQFIADNADLLDPADFADWSPNSAVLEPSEQAFYVQKRPRKTGDILGDIR